MSEDGRIDVAVLGATGAVGQTYVELLRDHPRFRVAEVASSERSAGLPYGDATRWRGGRPPGAVADLDVRRCTVDEVSSPIVFSALDSSVAGEIEASFARGGAVVLSNASSYRMADDVPLSIPEVNADHLALLERQREARGWPGAIVTNANCAATVVAVALAPLHEAFGLDSVSAVTLQAVSGAGYPGVPSLDILGNVVPFIAGEEPKIEAELKKILGSVCEDGVAHADFAVSAQANRVPVEHGHTACLSVRLRRRASVAEALEALRSWRGHDVCRGLPSAPDPPLVVHDAPDRPQPRRDAHTGGGMTVTVGRVREDPIFDLRLVAMAHNTVRGAAGGSILNAEVLGRLGALPGVEAGAW
jgi:aspartate-semialdehyde dehydrogenase